MKKILLFLLLVLSFNIGAKNAYMNAKTLQVKIFETNEETSQSCNVDIVVSEGQITIYSAKTQIYTINEVLPDLFKDGYQVLRYKCVNFNGLNCEVQFWTSNYKQQVVRIGFSDCMWEYWLNE